MNQELNKSHNADCLEFTKSLDDESIDCAITSPPYYQLRDYGWTGQWGLEKTYQEYLDHLIELTTELKRVLKPAGTMWINLGDTYGTKSGNMTSGNMIENKIKYTGGINDYQKPAEYHKSLLLIPHRFAMRCIDELGLILRNDIIWAKPNGMPESVTDRFSKKHEFFFFFVKQQKYYFDLGSIKDPQKTNGNRPNGVSRNRLFNYDSKANNPDLNHKATTKIPIGGNKKDGFEHSTIYSGNEWAPSGLKNPGTVSDFWDIPTQPSSEKHYAIFNYKLIDKPILAGCPEGGVLFDPFAGTGTTLVRGLQLNRKVIGCDGKPEYCEIANRRITEFQSQGVLAL